MCLVQNVKIGLILTISPTYYSSWFFVKIRLFLIQQKISKLNRYFERSYKRLLNALFSFEIGHS